MADGLSSRPGTLFSAACRFFGSWHKAVEEAGLDYDKIRKITRWSGESIIAEIRRLDREDEDLCPWAAQKSHKALYGAACRFFGSWHKAVEEAGLDYDKIRKKKFTKWTRESILEILKSPTEIVANPSRYASWEEAGYARMCQAAVRTFGSWHKALEEAGLTPIIKGKLRWHGSYTDWRVVYRIIPDVVTPNGKVAPNPRRLTSKEIRVLSQEVQKGNFAARDALILTHKYLVAAVVRKVFCDHRETTPGLEKGDLGTIGIYGLTDNIGGLARAIELYDPQRGVPLYRYAWLRIYGAMTRYCLSLRKKAVKSLQEPISNEEGASSLEDFVGDNRECGPMEVLSPEEALRLLIEQIRFDMEKPSIRADWRVIGQHLLEILPEGSNLFRAVEEILRNAPSSDSVCDELTRLIENPPSETSRASFFWLPDEKQKPPKIRGQSRDSRAWREKIESSPISTVPSYRWSKESIIAEIRRFDREGEDLSSGAARKSTRFRQK